MRRKQPCVFYAYIPFEWYLLEPQMCEDLTENVTETDRSLPQVLHKVTKVQVQRPMQ